MSKIVYLPLDERPCNFIYPQMLANMTDLEFISPDRSILGNKKEPADFKKVEDWLLKNTIDVDYLIISIDMLVYGGIVPSRLHTLSAEVCKERLGVLKRIKTSNPEIKIYAFDLIMRVPAYNNDDEEPAYYSQYGYRIYLYGFLMDKQKRGMLKNDEKDLLASVTEEIPSTILDDFVHRRKVNAQINTSAIEFVEEGIIEDLVIPLDDNSEYGFSAAEQRDIMLKVEKLNLIDRVFIYPGADEIGCMLFARVFCKAKQHLANVLVRYSSTLGPFIMPALEDRSLGESIKSQLIASNAMITENEDAADVVLMVNSPGAGQSDMAGPIPYEERHHSYFTEINYKAFIENIRHFAPSGKTVALADVSTINGSDHTLMKLLSKNDLLDDIHAYAGWNTSGNALGTVIAHAVIQSYYRKTGSANNGVLDATFYYRRLVEDWGYQAVIRQEVTASYLDELGATYFDISSVEPEVQQLVYEKLNHFMKEQVPDIGKKVEVKNISFPWKRMFEVEFDLLIHDQAGSVSPYGKSV